jgi:hypothetical protein
MVTYICIDDVLVDRTALIEDLTEVGDLNIKAVDPIGDIDKQIGEIEESGTDGVLLDYVLRVKGEAKRPDRFSNSLAQQLRDNATLGIGRDKPVVLWSSAKNFRDYYEHESTARDLYDLRIDKTTVPDKAQEIAKKLTALVSGYHEIAKYKDQNRDGLILMLGVSVEEAADILDPRVGDPFVLKKTRPEHEYARYIIHDLLSQPNPLVDEELLLARLGVDSGRSKERDLAAIFEELASCTYRGAFHDGWQRWWWQRVWDWWTKKCGTRSLQEMPSDRRVALLNEKGGLALIAAEPIEKTYSTAYWSVCEVYRRPLDPTDGFQASNSSVQPWHDARYLSGKAALAFEGLADGIDVQSIDRSRFDLMRKSLDGSSA